MFTKILGVFIFAAGTMQIFDEQRYLLGIILIVAGSVIVLAPVPMVGIKGGDAQRDVLLQT